MSFKTRIQNLRLSYALMSDNIDLVEKSILKGADINKVGIFRGITPLMSAKLNKDTLMEEMLIRHGAKVSLKEKRLLPSLKHIDEIEARVEEMSELVDEMAKEVVARHREEKRQKRKQRLERLTKVLIRK